MKSKFSSPVLLGVLKFSWNVKPPALVRDIETIMSHVGMIRLFTIDILGLKTPGSLFMEEWS